MWGHVQGREDLVLCGGVMYRAVWMKSHMINLTKNITEMTPNASKSHKKYTFYSKKIDKKLTTVICRFSTPDIQWSLFDR